MNRSNFYVLLVFFVLCFLWLLWPTEKEAEVLVQQKAEVLSINTRIQTEKPKKPAPISTTKRPEPKRVVEQALTPVLKRDKYDLFKKKHKNEAFIKIVDNVALTGGDQIVGFVEPSQDFNKESFYKSTVKKSLLWTDSIVPYGYADNFPKELFDTVERAIDYFNKETGVRFVEFDENQDEDAVVFTFKPKLPCSSFVGRIGGLQQVFLHFDCDYQSVLHEMMHALGFVHEQQLPYRDNYVDILWSNISEESIHNFAQVPELWAEHYLGTGADFDYNSIMIYHDAAFARPGLKSMKSKTDNLIAPNTQGLSVIDLERLDALY